MKTPDSEMVAYAPTGRELEVRHVGEPHRGVDQGQAHGQQGDRAAPDQRVRDQLGRLLGDHGNSILPSRTVPSVYGCASRWPSGPTASGPVTPW